MHVLSCFRHFKIILLYWKTDKNTCNIRKIDKMRKHISVVSPLHCTSKYDICCAFVLKRNTVYYISASLLFVLKYKLLNRRETKNIHFESISPSRKANNLSFDRPDDQLEMHAMYRTCPQCGSI